MPATLFHILVCDPNQLPCRCTFDNEADFVKYGEMFTAIHPTQEEVSDIELLEIAVRNAGSRSHRRRPRWAHVRDMFVFGKTSAHELCWRFNIDPDEMMGGDINCETDDD